MTDENTRQVETIRAFNRYYTNVLSLLDQHILESGYSLAEARVLHETALAQPCTAAALSASLSMDAGYLSRILKRLEAASLLIRERSAADARASSLRLSPEGERALAELNRRSDAQIAELISGVSETGRRELIRSMTSIETVLTRGKALKPGDIRLRTELRPGDAGYITAMHGRIYSEEYGYGVAFEGYVAQSFFEFLRDYDPERDRLWCAEHAGRTIGCIGVKGRGERAQLRWFLLEPEYRGMGLGRRLLQSALDFARERGYESAYLDTTDDLHDALRLYRRAGFETASAKPNNTWRENVMEIEMTMKL